MGIRKADNNSPSLSSSSSGSVQWQDAPTEFTQRGGVITEIWGPTGSGRTSLAFTAPGPIAYIYFHEKISGIVQKFSKLKEIRLVKAGGVFRGSEEDIISLAWKEMERYEAAYYDAFNWARTVILDTHNEAWYLERLAEFGAPKPSKGRIDRNWAPINNRWMSMLNMARTQEKTNIILIGQTEDEWKDTADGFGKKTGKLIRVSTTASNQVLLKSDISIRTDKKEKKDGIDFIATIYKGWWNAESEGQSLKNNMSTYGNLLGLVTDTDAEEWE